MVRIKKHGCHWRGRVVACRRAELGCAGMIAKNATRRVTMTEDGSVLPTRAIRYMAVHIGRQWWRHQAGKRRWWVKPSSARCRIREANVGIWIASIVIHKAPI